MPAKPYAERYKPVDMLHEPIYERQPRETRVAFEAFSHYRDSLEGRSLRTTAQALHKSLTQMGGWNRVWRWQERVDAWDAQLDAERRKASVKAVRDMGERHAQAAVVLMARALAGLQLLDVSEVRGGDLARMLDTAVKIERLSRGEPTEIQDATRPLSVRVLTDAELDALEGVGEAPEAPPEPERPAEAA